MNIHKSLLLGAMSLAFAAVAVDASAATCTDAKGKKYDCKVANKPVAATPAKSTVPQSVLAQPAKPAKPVVGTGSANKGNQGSVTSGPNTNGGKIVAQGGGNIISTNGGGLKK